MSYYTAYNVRLDSRSPGVTVDAHGIFALYHGALDLADSLLPTDDAIALFGDFIDVFGRAVDELRVEGRDFAPLLVNLGAVAHDLQRRASVPEPRDCIRPPEGPEPHLASLSEATK